MKTKSRQNLAYIYRGPAAYHSWIGQIMATLGYTGGHEERQVGAVVHIALKEDHLFISCEFEQWHSEATLLRDNAVRNDVKDCLLHWHSRAYGIPLSQWGTLIGVRPIKLVHHLFDQGIKSAEAEDYLRRMYHVQAETAQQLVHMADVQRPYVWPRAKHIALYIGIPFCPSHCLYCSFPSRLVGNETGENLHQFAEALVTDINSIHDLCRQYDLTVDTIYVGGGTPTCLPTDVLERILKAIQVFLPATEYTVEAGRPDTVTPAILQLLRRYGVDRISVNPQTMQQRILNALGRLHRVDDIYRMYNQAKQIGFPIVNMDFIAGLPGQTVEDMQENMKIVCQLAPENVTIHTLALKKGAPLFHHPLRQEIPSEQVTAHMLQICQRVLTEQGYIPYYLYRQKYMAATFANVGYALPGTLGVYNIEMMEERQTVLAAGPGGATKFLLPDHHSLSKLYMPKEIDKYVQTLPQNMVRRHHLCANIYGGEDLEWQ